MKKANSKLQNNKAIRQMLDGTHRTQTRKSISAFVGNKENLTKREIGDRWTDANGTVWEQKDGYRVQGADRLDRIAEIRKYLDGATECPECSESMNNRNDKKYYNIHKMCMECSLKKETRMRADGTWKAYEKSKVLANVTAWLRDAEIEKEVLINQICDPTYINGDGTLEKWEVPYDIKEQKERIEKGFVEFKLNLLTKYGATETELQEFGVALEGEPDEKIKIDTK